MSQQVPDDSETFFQIAKSEKNVKLYIQTKLWSLKISLQFDEFFLEKKLTHIKQKIMNDYDKNWRIFQIS